MWSGNKSTTCNGESLDSPNYNTKKLTQSNHQELRRKSMYMHLEGINDALIGPTNIERLTDYVDTVFAVYKSLQSYYICCKYIHISDQKWKFAEIDKVIIYSLLTVRCIIKNLLK